MAEFMFPNVAYRATVYRTGVKSKGRVHDMLFFFEQDEKMNQSNVLILYQQRNRRVSSTPVLNSLPGINNNELYNSCNLGIIGKIVRRNFIFPFQFAIGYSQRPSRDH